MCMICPQWEIIIAIQFQINTSLGVGPQCRYFSTSIPKRKSHPGDTYTNDKYNMIFNVLSFNIFSLKFTTSTTLLFLNYVSYSPEEKRTKVSHTAL